MSEWPGDLAGEWRLRDARGEHDLPITLPCDVHTALQRAGRLPDPYDGTNEYGCRWVSERDWRLTRTLDLERVPDRATLLLDMVDTVAEVRVNGHTVMRPDNMFRPWAAEVAGALRPGGNEIEIRLLSPVREGAERAARQPYRVPHLAKICPIPHGNMLRKPQCDFGWDWNIALAPMGVYGDMTLAGPEGLLGPVMVEQEHLGDGRVRVRARARVLGAGPDPADRRVTLTVGGEEAHGRIGSDRGGEDAEAVAEVTLADPALWWPAGQGEQALHDLTLEVGPLVHRDRVALRDVRLVTEPDAEGARFEIHVNGRPVFAKGANWIPPDALPGRMDEDATRDLLASARDAHMNLVRVWGGGRYEPDAFYRACDELGLLVWQDFMFACNLYPCTEAFLGAVEEEVDHQVRRLHHRVALWCGDNELVGALGWFEESRADRDRYLVAYDRLNRTIERGLRARAPSANWWPSSPSHGPLSFGDAFHADHSGDMHFWAVWHEGHDFEHYRSIRPRFVSEFGFQSFPSHDVIAAFADRGDHAADSAVMESHQKDPGGNARIVRTLARYFPAPRDFGEFVWLSQVQQATAIRTGVEYWRTIRPRCMGAVIWQLNDTWPCASWSSLDHGGGWKLLHHAARRFYAPVAAFGVPDGAAGIIVHGVNDDPAPREIGAVATVFGPDGRALREVALAGQVSPGTARPLGGVAALGKGETVVLATRTGAMHEDGGGGRDGAERREVVWPERFAGLAIGDDRDAADAGDGLAVAVEGPDGTGAWTLTISADRLALFVTLSSDRPGRFSDNAVPVWPGAPMRVTFTPRDAATSAVPRFRVRHLRPGG